jgi:hypothetical protein
VKAEGPKTEESRVREATGMWDGESKSRISGRAARLEVSGRSVTLMVARSSEDEG